MGTLALVNGIVAVVLFAGLTLVVSLQVFTRFVLHTPLIWSEEVARFLFFWVVLLGSAMSVKTRRHFILDIGIGRKGRVGGKWRFFSNIIPDLCILGFSVLLFYQGIGYTRVGLLRVAPNSQINMALVYVGILVFAALSIVYLVGNLLLDHGAFVRGEAAETRPQAGEARTGARQAGAE